MNDEEMKKKTTESFEFSAYMQTNETQNQK
jgi:hypothetical protein